MIIKCEKNISQIHFSKIISEIKKRNLTADILREIDGQNNPVIGLRGDCTQISEEDFAKLDGVLEVKRISNPYKLASREYSSEDTVINVRNIKIGGSNPVVFMAGPCAVESAEQILRIAKEVKAQGAKILRGGAWKPRTFARKFEGLKGKALKYLKKASAVFQMPIISEITDTAQVDLIDEYVDIFQVGARNMQNFDLLDKLGRKRKPVLLKRGISATIEEFLGAADRILEGGNKEVMLCLRGIRTFDLTQRFSADLYAIPDLRKKSHLPIIFDPSHAAGKREYVPDIAKMALVGGVAGLIIETHYNPAQAICDGAQMITPLELGKIIKYAKFIENVNTKICAKNLAE